MASKVHSWNGTAAETSETVTEFEIRAIDVGDTERTVEAAPEKEVEQLDDHPTVTELTLAGETTIPKKVHSTMASKVHSWNETAVENPQHEISPTAAVETERTVGSEVKEAQEEAKPVADHPTVTTILKKKWRGWPGDCVFRVIVPVLKVQSIIGRNGDLIKKMCEETKANIRVLEGSICDPNRIVQISGKEDIEALLSPAMEAVIGVFKLVNGFPENESGGVSSIPFCSIQLLVPLMQATSLIGKQGSPIKEIQENTGCFARILSCDEVSTLSINSDDRVIDLQGEGLKVLQALEAVLGHLRMFLVDHTILPLVEKTHNVTSTTEKHKVVTWAEKSIAHADMQPQRESLFLDRGPHQESQLSSSGLSCFGHDPGLSTRCLPGFGRTAGPSVSPVKTGPGRAFLGPVKPEALKTPTFQPPGFSQGSVDQALTRPASQTSLKPQDAVPLVPPSTKTSLPSAATETPVKPQKELVVEVSSELPQIQSATSSVAIEIKVEVPPELPQVQPATAPKAKETKPEKPVVPVSSDNSSVIEMEAEEPLMRVRPRQDETTVLDGMEHFSKSKRSRGSWEDKNVVQTFLDACIHEIAINGREGGSLKAKSWKKVGEILEDKHNFSVDHKQMKNYFDGLESRYRSWLMLKNKIKNIYDPSLDDDIKKNKYIEELWNASPPFPDLCAQLFDAALSTSIKSFSEDIRETEIQKDTMSLSSPSSPVNNKKRKGEVSHELQSSPLATTETPHERESDVAQPQKVCSFLVQVPAKLPQVQPATALKPIETKPQQPLGKTGPGGAFFEPAIPVVLNRPTFYPINPDRSAPFSFALSSSSSSSQSPFSFASSSSSTPFSTPLPTFGFGGSGSGFGFGLFGSHSPMTTNLFGWTSTFGTSNIFGVSSSSTTTCTAVTPPFSSGLFGSSSPTPIPSFWSAGSTPTSSFSFANVTTTSTALQSSSISKTASTTLTTTTAASETLSFPAFGVTYSSTQSAPIFTSPTTASSTGTPTSFLGFQTSSKTVPATTPQSTATSSFFGMESIKEPKRNKRKNRRCNVAGGLSGEASFLIPPSAPPLPTTESPQKEQMVEVPLELPQVQPASELVSIETKQLMSVFEEEMLGVLKMIADKINKPQPPSKPTFEDCEKKLNELGWPKNDPLHLVALTIFYDENDNYRKLWMKLNPNLCADWVRMIGRGKRFL